MSERLKSILADNRTAYELCMAHEELGSDRISQMTNERLGVNGSDEQRAREIALVVIKERIRLARMPYQHSPLPSRLPPETIAIFNLGQFPASETED